MQVNWQVNWQSSKVYQDQNEVAKAAKPSTYELAGYFKNEFVYILTSFEVE